MFPVIHVGQYEFYSFGIMVGLGTVLPFIAVRSYFTRHGIGINPATLWAIVVFAGLLGAKLDYVVLYDISGVEGLFQRSPLDTARGGFTYFGGLIAGMIAACIFIWVQRLPFLKMFDALFCVGLGYGTGRIGCFLAGDGDYGTPSNLPWAISFPHGIVPTIARVHPTMLYSSAWEFAVFGVLWRLSNPERQPSLKPGVLLGSYLIATGCGRFLVEFLSLNPKIALDMTEAQLVSAALACSGVCILVRVNASRIEAKLHLIRYKHFARQLPE